MDFSKLKAFYQVAISGNFSKAADELFVSQPALSRQVASLEKELELQLFTRQGRQVVTTDAGRRLLVYAEKIICLSNEAKKEMLEFKDLTTAELTLGASTTIANYLLPKVLALYQKKNPGISINLKVGNSTEIEEMASEGRVDLGLVASKISVPRLYQEQFAEDELSLVVSGNHCYLKDTDDNLTAQLCQETFLCRENGSDTQRLLDSLLSQLNINPKHRLILGDTEAIKRGVINNMGIAFLSTYTFEYESQLGLLVPLKKISMKRPLLLIYPKGTRLSPAALAFSAILKKNIS
ncbi:MAG: LysR substrate-binding domain-containing protein [Bacillota bacterium]